VEQDEDDRVNSLFDHMDRPTKISTRTPKTHGTDQPLGDELFLWGWTDFSIARILAGCLSNIFLDFLFLNTEKNIRMHGILNSYATTVNIMWAFTHHKIIHMGLRIFIMQ
jgi:hypothetical protein